MIIYFSKINLCTVELFNAYKEENIYKDLRSSIASYLKTGIIFKTVETYIGADGQIHNDDTLYRMSLHEKEEDHIWGVIYKEAHVWYKEINPKTGEIESKTRPTIEDVQFYYDITREIVGFHTRNRFGYQEFNHAFEEMINSSLLENDKEYKISVSLYNEGLEIGEIEQQLKEIKNIKRLIFNFKVPNPADDDMLDDLSEGLDNALEQMEEANANSMSVIFDSSGRTLGLNVDSQEIKNNIQRIGRIHSKVSGKDAIKNGYATVKAIDKHGKIYTTEERKPIKREIMNELEFVSACKETIIGLFSSRKAK